MQNKSTDNALGFRLPPPLSCSATTILLSTTSPPPIYTNIQQKKTKTSRLKEKQTKHQTSFHPSKHPHKTQINEKNHISARTHQTLVAYPMSVAMSCTSRASPISAKIAPFRRCFVVSRCWCTAPTASREGTGRRSGPARRSDKTTA